MLWPVSVYCLRIKQASQEDRRRTVFAKQLFIKDIKELVINSRNSVVVHNRVKIILLFFILNCLSPIMGQIQTVDRVQSTHTDERLTDIPEQYNAKGRFLENKDFLDDQSGCILCRIKESLNQNHRNLDGAKFETFSVQGSIFDAKTRIKLTRKRRLQQLKYNNKLSPVLKPQQKASNNLKILVRNRRNIGDRRRRMLYCRAGTILRILPNGKVDGTYEHRSPLVPMIIQTVDKGTVSIKSEETGLYLAMKPNGLLYATKHYDRRFSAFREFMPDGRFTTYSIKVKRRRTAYVGLTKRGKTKRGTKINENHISSHFMATEV